MDDALKAKALLQGLGRATNRGIKKCPKCGTWNGTRGVFCKNIQCDHLLKNVDDQSFKSLIKACKLITDDNTHIFSVRTDDKGLDDHRGFVQLPLNNSSKGLCFIDKCPKTFNSEILKVHEKGQQSKENSTPCHHIEAAINCVATTSSIALNPMIIDSMDLLPNVKEGLWDLLSDNFSTSGPVVQRISTSVFVVKCKTSPKHPLGYLHLTISNSVEHKDKSDYKHYCDCPVEYKDLSSSSSEDMSEKKCVHYYAVICSFASDQKLAAEFSHFMESEQMLTLFVNQYLSHEEDNDQLVAIFNVHPEILEAADNVSMSQKLEGVELITTDPTELKLLSSEDNSVYTYLTIGSTAFDENIACATTTLSQDQFAEARSNKGPMKDTKRDPTLSVKSKMDDFKSKRRKRIRPNKNVLNKEKIINTSSDCFITPSNETIELFQRKLARYVDKKPSLRSLEQMQNNLKTEENISSEFLRWIASISERIYLEMHYQFECTKPKTLTFFPTPMNFFKPLRERLATLGPKRRLPNSTVAFISKTPPVGTFTKYKWVLNNIIHVKQVLDNPHFPLKLTRSFISSGPDTYIPSPVLCDPTPTPTLSNLPRIKPIELVTYLKVGHTQPWQVEPTPFTLEFVSDLLPESKMGELKIRFEYGHLHPVHNR